MFIRQFTSLFFPLLTALLCTGEADGGTLELPREDEPEWVFQRVDIAGQPGMHYASEHYLITASRLDDAHRAGQRLEHLFRAWHLLSAEHFGEQANGQTKELDNELDNEVEHHRRHRIVLFRDQQEYNRALLPLEPSIARTNGFYFAPGKTAYFYSTEAKILFHEGTHQILMEHIFRNTAPSFRNNFWVVEGIAAFMETLKIEEHSYKVGDILADKLLAAKIYQFERNYHMPIQRLTAMSAADVQASAETQRIYSQSATLVHWLMFAEGGRYRQHLFELLRQTYVDLAVPETLSRLTGLSYEELDQKYAEFLQTIPEPE